MVILLFAFPAVAEIIGIPHHAQLFPLRWGSHFLQRLALNFYSPDLSLSRS
jgi:hypothetical protein